jgi:hypothetical protein
MYERVELLGLNTVLIIEQNVYCLFIRSEPPQWFNG